LVKGFDARVNRAQLRVMRFPRFTYRAGCGNILASSLEHDGINEPRRDITAMAGTDSLQHDTKKSYDRRINQSVREYAQLELDDPRRRQIEEEVSRIRLISKSMMAH